MRRVCLAVILVMVWSSVGHAQFAVYDAAVTARNRVSAITKELLLALQREQHSQLRRMAQRLSLFTSLTKYSVPEAPRWRTHSWEDNETFLFATPYHAALNYGDASGAAYLGVSHHVLAAADALGRLTPSSRRALAARLATLDAAGATIVTATHDTGQLRFNGRRELAAIEALEGHVIDPSTEQSATAVLDKISGAALIAARQRQARSQLLTGIVEQLLVDGKRARDAETAGMNMQLVAWRDRAAVNDAFVRGSGDALRAWRQP